jgi:gliding motility-associated-like protein
LPENDSWTLTLTPGNSATSGSGSTSTISGLVPGTYRFSVTNSKGCTSGLSESFAIIEPSGAPLLVIDNPPPVCFPSTVDLTDPKITSGSALNLSYTYWTDSAATMQYQTPGAATTGIYFIKGTSADGLFSVKPVTVLVFQIPVANAGPDQILSSFETTMDATLADNYETGVWSVISGTGEFLDPASRMTPVTGLSKDNNVFLWTVSNEVCPESSDTVIIIVNNLAIPTLITPNMDGKNDYLIIKGSDATGRIELEIFDRRGIQVYKNANYDNSWNGINYKGYPLPEDTYFYILKTNSKRAASGYIVVRR